MERRSSVVDPPSSTGSRGSQNSDDYHEKQSKIQRDSRAFIVKTLLIMCGLTIFALGLSILNQEELPQQAKSSQSIIVDTTSNNGNNVAAGAGFTASTDDVESTVTNKGNTNAYNQKSFQEVDDELAAIVDTVDERVRALKMTGVIMETDKEGLKLTNELKEATTKLLEHRYGANTLHTKFRVVVDLIFPPSVIKDPDSESNTGQLTIDLAPISLLPCAVFYFMEIARTYKSGEFHRNAGHVLQAAASSEATAHHKSMPFQEYSPKFPHAKYTTGYAGRPSGPGWYISIQDNTQNHGPGSQQKKNPYEADSNFGKLTQETIDSGVVQKIHSVPENGWLSKKNTIKIIKMTLMVNSKAHPDKFVEWKPTVSTAS